MGTKSVPFAAQYRDPKWQKKRLEVMEEDDFACVICGDKESTLNVHHICYLKDLKVWEYAGSLVTLCDHCHKNQHFIIDELKFAAATRGGVVLETLETLNRMWCNNSDSVNEQILADVKLLRDKIEQKIENGDFDEC